VERNHGCNHMTCICGAEFCYLCGKPYEDRQQTCDCGLFQTGLP
jgi:ariadne-1